MFNVDLVIEEIEAPITRWCNCHHLVPEYFKRGGKDSKPEKTKFFSVKGRGINGIFCEPCLIVARYAAKHNKKI